MPPKVPFEQLDEDIQFMLNHDYLMKEILDYTTDLGYHPLFKNKTFEENIDFSIKYIVHSMPMKILTAVIAVYGLDKVKDIELPKNIKKHHKYKILVHHILLKGMLKITAESQK